MCPNILASPNPFSGCASPFVKSGDLVMAYTGSGNSANVVNALKVANEKGVKTFAMTKGDGGKCKEIADICLIVPGTSNFPGQTGKNDNNFHIEDFQTSIMHIVTGLLKNYVSKNNQTIPF